MITSLSIQNQNSDILQISNQNLQVNVQNDTIKIGIQSIEAILLNPIQDAQFVKSINNVQPFQDGTFNILGSQCTSLYSAIQKTEGDFNKDVLTTAQQKQMLLDGNILLYDGCTACQSCNAIWGLYEALQEAHLWSVAMKDCILYKQDTAKKLWDQTLASANISKVQNNNCEYTYKVTDPQYRKHQFNKAMRLLQQYKATVTAWNYLCFLNTSTTQILDAVQDWSGFVVQTKKRINNCQTEKALHSTQLVINLSLFSGQLPSYLKNDVPLQKGRARTMLFLVLPVVQNTYIQIGTDTGNQKQYVSQQQNNIDFKCQIIAPSAKEDAAETTTAQQTIRCTFKFNNLPLQQVVLSASVKILPVIVYSNQHTGAILLDDIKKYVKHRIGCTDIHSDQQSDTNKWEINLGWKDMPLDINDTQEKAFQFTETRIYSTGFCKYPSKIHQQLQEK